MNKNKLVIYTTIFGGYEVPIQPENIPPNVEFICFTDDPSMEFGIWSPRLIRSPMPPRDLAYRIRILPHKYLEEYDYSLYVDGNIDLRKQLPQFLDLCNNDFTALSHPDRDSIYDEAKYVVENGLHNAELAMEQVHYYRIRGFVDNPNVLLSGILFRKHSSEKIKIIMESWFNEYKKWSGRLELSLSYVLWQHNYEYKILKIDHYDSEYFGKFSHRPQGFPGVLHSEAIKQLGLARLSQNAFSYNFRLILYFFFSIMVYATLGKYRQLYERICTRLEA